MPLDSNIDDVGNWLAGVIGGINMNIAGPEFSLAHDIADGVANGIEKRSDEQQRGAVEVWPKNSEPYRTNKLRKYGTDKTNYRTKQMLSHRSLVGRLKIEPHLLTMEYGTGEYPEEGANGHIEDSDKMVTDIQKAWYAEKSGRKFYDLDQETTDAVIKTVEKSLGLYIAHAAEAH